MGVRNPTQPPRPPTQLPAPRDRCEKARPAPETLERDMLKALLAIAVTLRSREPVVAGEAPVADRWPRTEGSSEAIERARRALDGVDMPFNL